MYVHAHIPSVIRSRSSVQFGTAPNSGVIFDGLTDAEAAVLLHLPSALSRGHAVRYAARHGVSEDQLDGFVDQLCRAGVAARLHRPATQASPMTWSYGEDAHHVNRALRRSTIEVVGLSAAGIRLTHLLADAGVGTIHVSDPPVVQNTDVPLLPASGIGRPRTEATAGTITNPCTRVFVHPAAHSDLAVVVSGFSVPPTWAAPHMAADRPHLPIVVTEASIEVGPLVRPGLTPCLHCVDLTRRDDDPAWPVVAAQLRHRPVPLADPLTTTQAAAFAAREIIHTLTWAHAPQLEGTSWVWNPRDPVPLVRHWAPHADCACGAHDLQSGGD